jgi:ABC-type Fe3+/spermidine/putrescine transport system ATPase subunit
VAQVADGGAVSGLTVEGIEKRFGDVRAVRHVSFSVASGEFVSLVGPSG